MRRNYLVVVLPGIGGSVLAPDRTARPIWQARLSEVPNVLRRPERLSLAEHEFLEPVGLVKTRKVCGFWTPIIGYENLLTGLAGLPGVRAVDDGVPQHRRLDADVVAIPYDFRRSVAEAAERVEREIAQRLPLLWPEDSATEPQPRIIFVAHSMGGLVARYWAAQGDNMRRTRAVISLGTPHRGAPKALDILMNGVAIKNYRIRRPMEVLREWPGVAELLPQYPAIVDVSSAGSPDPLRPVELPLPWLQSAASNAAKTHRVITDCWEHPHRWPDMVARIGFGHGTLRRCVWDGHTVRVTRDPAGVSDLHGWDGDRGDGTVPAFSALPTEQDYHSPIPMRKPLRHGELVDLPEVLDLVESYERHRPPTAIHGARKQVGLGMDLDELVLAGESSDIAVRVTDALADVSGVAVWAEFAGADIRLEHDRARDMFVGQLPGAAAGLHEVVVRAEAVPDAGDLAASQLVEVIGDDGLE